MDSIHIQKDSPGITDVPNFEAAGIACDIRGKGDDRRDLALIYCRDVCTAAGVFTQNDMKAAPVQLCQHRLEGSNSFHGALINSGNANAATGHQGLKDAYTMADEAARGLGCAPEALFVCSTGRIGRHLPMPRIQKGIAELCQSKGALPSQGEAAAQAILTSDTRPKTVTLRFKAPSGEPLTLAGMAKGAGMIQPNMATMLAFLVTDVQINSTLLHKLLTSAVGTSFNRISIDGDMSTNDTVLLLANGYSKVAIQNDQSPLFHTFSEVLERATRLLAEKIVADGERTSKVVELHIKGAPSKAAAEKTARAIGNSLLVKTSWYGNDPNWGRIVHAAGYASVGLREDRIDLFYEDIPVLQKGDLLPQNERHWRRIVSGKRFTITLDLHLGDDTYWLLTTDLSEGYVNFNKTET